MTDKEQTCCGSYCEDAGSCPFNDEAEYVENLQIDSVFIPKAKITEGVSGLSMRHSFKKLSEGEDE